MDNVVRFIAPKKRSIVRPDQQKNGPTTAGSVDPHEDISTVLIAASYYVVIGDQKSAKRLLTYVQAFNPIPSVLLLPDDLHELVLQADAGEAIFPSVP